MSGLKITVLGIAGLLISFAFLLLAKREENSSERKERDRIMILQNVFNIPLCFAALIINLISPSDDPMIGLWILAVLCLMIPTVLGYLAFGLVIPALRLANNKEKPQTQLYWGNVVMLLAEVAAALMLI